MNLPGAFEGIVRPWREEVRKSIFSPEQKNQTSCEWLSIRGFLQHDKVTATLYLIVMSITILKQYRSPIDQCLSQVVFRSSLKSRKKQKICGIRHVKGI